MTLRVDKESRNRRGARSGFALSLIGLLIAAGVFRFLVLLILKSDFGMSPVELAAVPLCVAGLVLSWRAKPLRAARWGVAFAMVGLAIALIIVYAAFTFDGGSV
jgi:hypothetical protein